MASRHLERRYPPLFATTDPCASPKPSLRLRLLALVDGSLPVVSSPGWERDLPDVISADLSLRAWTPTPAAPAVHSPVSSHRTSAFPALGPGQRLASIPRSDFKRRLVLRGCSIRLPSGPQVCLPPRSPLPQFLLPWKLGSRGVSIRASHGSLPPHASDRLAVRTGQGRQGTFTPSDPQPCRLLPPRPRVAKSHVLCGRRSHRFCGRSCPAEAGGSPPILAHASGPGALPYFPARRVSFS